MPDKIRQGANSHVQMEEQGTSKETIPAYFSMCEVVTGALLSAGWEAIAVLTSCEDWSRKHVSSNTNQDKTCPVRLKTTQGSSYHHVVPTKHTNSLRKHGKVELLTTTMRFLPNTH